MNPDDDPLGRITIREIRDVDLISLVGFDPAPGNNTLTSNFPVAATIGSYSLPGNAGFTVNDADLFDGTPESMQTTGLDELENFNLVSPEAFLRLATHLGT